MKRNIDGLSDIGQVQQRIKIVKEKQENNNGDKGVEIVLNDAKDRDQYEKF